MFNGKKGLDRYANSTVDNLHEAGFDGTPAWFTLNTGLSKTFGSWFVASLAVNNILDHHYRPFASGISASGRNFILKSSIIF